MCRPIYRRVRCRQLHWNTAQTRTAVKINPQSADIYAEEGIPATFPSGDGKTVYGAELQQLDLHCRCARFGRWMGKNISWDSASRTVFPVRYYEERVLSVCG